jgi:ketosteroid isomerase-like protein
MRPTLAALLLAVCTTAPLAAQSASAPAAPSDPREAETSLVRADLQWSDTTARAGLATGFTSMLADEAVYLHPNAQVMRGREAVRGFLAAQPATAQTVLRWNALRAAVSADGRAGYTTGVSVVTVPGADGAPVTRFGRYITFWRRGADGRWTAAATMHARPPSRDPLVVPAGWSRGTVPDTARGGAATAMERADRAFAAMGARNGPEAAFTAFAAPDAVSVGQMIAVGPAEIGGGFHGDPSRWVWGPVLSGASPDGELGFTVGEAAITGPGPDGRESTRYSKYLTIWRRQPDGSYKYLTDGGNARPAPAGS